MLLRVKSLAVETALSGLSGRQEEAHAYNSMKVIFIQVYEDLYMINAHAFAVCERLSKLTESLGEC